MLIQRSDPWSETRCAGGVGDGVDRRREPPDEPPDGRRGQPPDLAEIALEGGPVDPEIDQLLVEDPGRDPVEEQVDPEDDHDEVVEHAEDRHIVRDDVERQGEVDQGAAEERLARWSGRGRR